jgi:uncharacterized membrane protein YccC
MPRASAQRAPETSATSPGRILDHGGIAYAPGMAGAGTGWAATARTAAAQGVAAAVVAVFCHVTARRFAFGNESYWAPIAAVVVLYPGRDETTRAGIDRFFGTAIGSVIGWASDAWWDGSAMVYGLALGLAVALCYLARRPGASRLCAVAVSVITLVPRSEPAHLVAFHRFIEVSYGVACALAFKLAEAQLARVPWTRLGRRGRSGRAPDED